MVEDFTVARICSQCLMSLGTLYKCLDGIPFAKDGLRFPPIRAGAISSASARARCAPIPTRCATG